MGLLCSVQVTLFNWADTVD